jgi:hypothetical protein
VSEGREVLAEVVASEKALAVRRMLAGRFFLKARKMLPARAKNREDGWTALLEALEVDKETVRRYIGLAEATLTLSESDSDKIPTYAELGYDKREGAIDEDAPHAATGDEPRNYEEHASVDVDVSDLGDTAPAIDHNTWCTPKWIADALGRFDLDPCANSRSHIQAERTCELERGDDGLHGETGAHLIGGRVFHATKNDRVYINPPYERGAVIRWVRAYKHTRFTFLLRLDTSTDWFDELFTATALILIPKGDRIEFEPPPGITASKNPYPHGLFFARTKDAPKELFDRCYVWRVE